MRQTGAGLRLALLGAEQRHLHMTRDTGGMVSGQGVTCVTMSWRDIGAASSGPTRPHPVTVATGGITWPLRIS